MKDKFLKNISKALKLSKTKLIGGVKVIKNKKHIIIPVALVSVLLTAIILLFVFPPVIKSENLPDPQITHETIQNTLNNSTKFSISIKNNEGIFVEYNGEDFVSDSKQVNIVDVMEGKQNFIVRTMKNYYIFKLVSAKYETLNVEFDYTEPYFEDESIDGIEDEYYSKINYITFKTTEEYINVYTQVNGESLHVYSDEPSSEDSTDDSNGKQLVCVKTVDTEDDSSEDSVVEDANEPEGEISSIREFTCPITFVGEGAYQVSIFVEDKAGNKNYIMENKSVKFVEPITLDCDELPESTNKSSINLNCVPSKSGSYRLYEETVQIEGGKTFGLQLNFLEEGENIIPVVLKDNDGREFAHSFTITRDTTSPQLNNLWYSDDIAWHKNLSISFNPSEAVTGTITVTVDKPTCSYWNATGSFTKSFSLDKNEKFSTSVNTGRFKTCSDFNDEVCVSPLWLILDITYTDKVGNTAKINSKGIRLQCTGEYCDTYWPIR